ncbi:MFS transporter [Akkermansiaceae bacterium]|nr:MFS transporter [Akkermansiaceae bacterium]MDB4757490.1 MFS transporter [Akkermansiaceae bacterium]MDB4770015.1 MFS transporter [Akkermansiaceae bacterium]
MSRSNRLFNRGFCALLITQFFGAINDSVLKQVIILAVASGGVWANQLGEGGQAYVALCLTIPFILFSGIAGQIADRISKNRITVLAKIAEVGIAALALGAFFAGNLWACLVVMVLLATQSAFFGPAKYGMIPELLKEKHLSKANGSINMFTNLAVIGGTLAAGKVYTHYSSGFQSSESEAPINPEMLWVPGVILVIIAMIGLLPSLFIPKLKSFDQPQPIDFNPFRPYAQALKDMAQSHLLLVALAWSFFYLLGMMALLVLPDFSALLQISPEMNNNLLGVLGITIGLGSVIAGFISGKHIEPRLIPVGALGMTLFFILLGIAPLSFWTVALLLGAAGLFGGFYIVPLQSLLQHLSPPDERGRFLGTANALSFVFSSIGALLVRLFRNDMGIPANKVFLAIGALAILGSGVLLWKIRALLLDPSLSKNTSKEAS